jgi:hypothetical protein
LICTSIIVRVFVSENSLTQKKTFIDQASMGTIALVTFRNRPNPSKTFIDQASMGTIALVTFRNRPNPSIDGQMGQTRWASTGTARKSTARARHHSASAGTRHDLDSAWAAGPAHGTSTGTT